MSGLPLGRELIATLETWAAQAYPEEACALIVGRGEPATALRLVACANVAQDRRRRFEVDPDARIRLEVALRGTDERLVGIWHSHPDGPARPSATDAAMVYEPDLFWVVTGLKAGEPTQTLAYRPNGTGFDDLVIEDLP